MGRFLIQLLKSIDLIFSAARIWKRAVFLVWEASPKYTACWILLSGVQAILPVCAAFLTKFAIDGIVAATNSNGDWQLVTRAIWFAGLIGFFLILSEVFQSSAAWLRTAQAETFSDFLSDKLQKKSSELDMAYYESPEYHDLVEQVRGDSSPRPLSLLENLGFVVQNFISIVGLGALLLTYGWWLPLMLLVGTFPALWLAIREDKKYHRWWESTATDRRWASYFDAMLTHPNAAAEMRFYDLGSHFRIKYQSIRGHLRREKLDRVRNQTFSKVAGALIGQILAAAVFAWIAIRVLYNQATLGDLGAVYQIFSKGQGIMSALMQGIAKAVTNTFYLERLFAYLDLRPKLVSNSRPRPPISTLRKGISFKSVSFSYPESTVQVIDDLDLFVSAGSVVALIGVNGAGKSTLIKLLNRFYDPTAGTIEFDGCDLRNFDPPQLRRMMSVLSQFPMQFHAAAKENIALGDLERESDQQEAVTAAQGAGAHRFISRLPEGYDTLLGKWFVNGTELSGGEWQRIALSRAYYRQASIVILDEPTSFMDPWSEADWFDRFRQMVDGQTGIVITHRFTVAMRADVIHVIDQGKIVESGTHQQLLDLNGSYAQSWKEQMQGVRRNESRIKQVAMAGNGPIRARTDVVLD